jgi:hypothetical protein
MFQSTRTFGPIIKIIQVMTLRLLKFVVIWWLLILCFVCVGVLLFPHTQKFNNVTNATYFLLCCSIGNWDAAVFEIVNLDAFGQLRFNDSDVQMGRVFILVFMMFDLIVLLNLVIAILAGTYSELA